jgi:hypothetical protein
MQLPCCYFIFYKKITLTKVVCFLMIRHYTAFEDPIFSGTSVAATSHVCVSTTLLLPVGGN